MRVQSRGHRRRDPGYTGPAELETALAPFRRADALTPFDLPGAFAVREEFVGSLRYHRMDFTPSARGTLLKLLDLDDAAADEALEWLASELRWPFLELLGHARAYTRPQLVAALLALARLHPDQPLPQLPPDLIRAVCSSERHRQFGNLLPEGVLPELEDLEHGAEVICELWCNLTSTAELARLADGLLRAVRRRRPGNWELLARRKQWEPLRQGTINCSARLWTEELSRPPRATKALLAFTIALLALIDPAFPRSPDEKLIESIRQRLAQALSLYRH